RDPDLTRIGGYQAESAEPAARELLDVAERPTAIFAANDVSAIATVAAARARGLSIPDDLSVIGFDNVPESALCEPPLTTIDQSVQRMGNEAVHMLIGLVDGRTDLATHVLLQTRLIVRGSCACR